ncbi:MAG: hypothetical protein HY815_08100 [Candidatus Riflebacteria bacterium]|nr:hypothetical protein [Candidatus Riflebacteria bacterium]
MTAQVMRDVLFWCSIVNLGILLVWFFAFTLAHDWLYRLHRLWFTISKENFDVLIYLLIGMFKILWLMFNVVPYLALRIAG